MRSGDWSAKIARKPASLSRMSHWNDRKSCPAEQMESHRTRHSARAARRAHFQGAKIAASAHAAPASQPAVSAPSLQFSQNSDGASPYAARPNASRAAGKNCAAGRMPREPISPADCTPHEVKAMK
jgi:hypothetical protein